MATANITTPTQQPRNTGSLDTVLAELDEAIGILSRQPEEDTAATAAMIHASTARAILRDIIQGHSVDEPAVIPNVSGMMLSSYDVRGLLNQAGNAYPELRSVMDVAGQMIIHLETRRHEALLPLALGNLSGVEAMLKQKAMVEVAHA